MSALTTTSPHPLRPQNFGELVEFAKMAARSTLVPRDYLGKPENILLAIQMGSEIGLAPMQSLQNISVINGRPSVWGDAMLGLCRQSPACKDVVERFEGEGKELTAVCIAKRAGAEPIERRFSMDDAERAGLASKAGTWQQYPKRMLQMRARGFALRDAFPDVLRGLISTEEAQDIPEEKFTGPTLEASPERQAINDAVPLTPKQQRMRGVDATGKPWRSAEGEDADRAEAAERERAAAASTPRPERKVDPTVYDAPRTRTRRDFLDGLAIALRDATSAEEVDRIVCGEEVMRAKEAFTNGSKAELDKLIAAALKKWWHEAPEPDLSDEALGEVEIEGAEKIGAG